MNKILIIIFFTFILSGCNDNGFYKSNIDSLGLANSKIENEIKDLQLRITIENNRLDKERQQKEQLEREKRISSLKVSVNGTYTVGKTSCSISNNKITWSAGKSYNKIIYNGELYGNKSYYEYDNSGYYIGEFIFYQDYSKGTYVRKDMVTFEVTKLLY
jgi:hypothetical protein